MTKENQTQQPVVAESTVSGAMTDERSAFETFVKTSTSQNITRDQNGFYTDAVTYDWWKVWQAARRSRAQDAQAVRNAALEEAAQACEKRLHREFSRTIYAVSSCRDAIRALQSAPAQPVERPDAVPLSKNWDEDTAHENGRYQNICAQCSGLFIGHKRRVICKQCAAAAWNAIAANQPQRGNAQEPFGYFHELLNHEGKGTGVWLGCPDKESVEKAHVEGETGNEIVPLYAAAPQVAWLSEQWHPTPNGGQWIAVATTSNPTGWDGFRNAQPLYAAAPQSDAQQISEKDAALEDAVQAVAERAGDSETILVINAFAAIRGLKKNRFALGSAHAAKAKDIAKEQGR